MNETKILVIDDEQTYLDLITETLNAKKYKILQALNGKMGCMVAQKFIPDIIITDWEMPEMNGIETLHELKNNPITKDIPVIMCTGIMTSSQNLNAALNAGAVDYIRKPVESIELIARINSALNLSESIRRIKSQNEDLKDLNAKIIQKNDEIIAQNEQLLYLNATKDKFFGIIAHDLRNPFNNILGLTELLVNEPKEFNSSKCLEFVKTIHNSAHSAYKLLSNLLDWAMMQTGRTAFRPEFILLEDLIIDTLEITSVISQAKNISVYSEKNLGIQVFADKNMLNIILGNLLTNAIKYTQKNGTVKIEVSTIGDMVQISVIDNGIGIDGKTIGKLFQINEKISTLGTENEKGTGLGLILCKEFTDKHGGKIGVESELGKGSKFWIKLPFGSIKIEG